MQEQFAVSERRACAVVGQARAAERYVPRESADEAALTARVVALATRFGRYGYRRITALLHREGWQVNHKRVERLWRQEGLRVPQKQPKRGRLWLADGSIVRLRTEHPNHVWRTTSCSTTPPTGASCECSPWSTSTPASAWRSKWRAG
jgi:putative transposase